MLIAPVPDTGRHVSSLRSLSCEDRGDRNEILQVVREDGFDFSGREYFELFETAEATAFQHPRWLGHFYEKLDTRKNLAPFPIS